MNIIYLGYIAYDSNWWLAATYFCKLLNLLAEMGKYIIFPIKFSKILKQIDAVGPTREL